MIIIAIIFLIVGIVLFFVQRDQKSRALSIKSARPVTAEDLNSTAAEVAKEIGGGSWRDYVKIWGTTTVKQPLLSELKGEPCVYYTMSVQREYEETVVEKDDDGNSVQKIERRSETVASNKQFIPFYVKDATGEVLVNPDKAAIETVQIVEEFRPGDAPGGHLSFGQFSRTLGMLASRGQRTVGYRYTESILPLGRNILVVGAASDHTGVVTLEKPINSDKKFIISLKADDALAADADKNAQLAFYGMIGCFATGACLLVVGLIL